MKHKVFVLLCFLSLSFFQVFSVSSKIIETKDFSTIEEHLTHPATLIVFDLDDTLFSSTSLIGSSSWFYNRVLNLKDEQGLTEAEALKIAAKESSKIQALIRVAPVDSRSAGLIQNWQERGFLTMGLTSRGKSIAPKTIEFLASVNIHLAHPNYPFPPIDLVDYPRAGYQGQIVFVTDHYSKGEVLVTTIRQISRRYPIKKVIFIDDKIKHVQAVSESMARHGIDYVGIRYGAMDHEKENFSMDQAMVEFRHFQETGALW